MFVSRVYRVRVCMTGCAGTLLRAWLALRRHSGRGAAAGETCAKRSAGLNNRTLVLKTVPLDDLNLLDFTECIRLHVNVLEKTTE